MICACRRKARNLVRFILKMFSPLYSTWPALGCSKRSKRRPRVLLPEPDSPTTARVCPALTFSETASTARTADFAPRKLARTPASSGKCLLKPTARNRGGCPLVVEDTGNLLLYRDLRQLWRFFAANRFCMRAARVKAATFWSIGQSRYSSLDIRQTTAGDSLARH